MSTQEPKPKPERQQQQGAAVAAYGLGAADLRAPQHDGAHGRAELLYGTQGRLQPHPAGWFITDTDTGEEVRLALGDQAAVPAGADDLCEQQQPKISVDLRASSRGAAEQHGEAAVGAQDHLWGIANGIVLAVLLLLAIGLYVGTRLVVEGVAGGSGASSSATTPAAAPAVLLGTGGSTGGS